MGAGVVWVGQDGAGVAGFDDGAVVHEDEGVAGFAGEAHFVGDDDHGHAVGGEVAHDVEDFADEFGVQGGGGFVEEHEFGAHGQGAGDRDALLLAAGELAGVGGGLVGQPDAGQQGVGAVQDVASGFAADPQRGFDDVAQGGHVREQVEPLEDHADLGAFAGDLGFS